MNMKLRFGIVLFMLVSLIGGAATPHAFANTNAAYVEPALLAVVSGDVSIIVAADNSATAASAVQRAGGRATSDLWLIDSVAATLPANQIAALAAMPGIRSIVANRGIK